MLYFTAWKMNRYRNSACAVRSENMKISGFTFVRNGAKMDYPMKEAILSILPICDEFVIALGAGDEDDTTREQIVAIGSDKIKIIDTEWKDLETLRARVYSQQTNIALDACEGDWCFYIQLDEVIHEKYLSYIKELCERYLNDSEVEGFLFNYKHFWGDYDHYFNNHKWYPREVRIVRNGVGIRSVGDAQSFRMSDDRKLKVVHLNADVYHYGYVRHPRKMQARNLMITANYWGQKKAAEMYEEKSDLFDYGPLNRLEKFTEEYPEVMKERVAALDWKDLLREEGKLEVTFNHDRLKYRIITFIEQKIFGGRYYFGYRPYKILKKKKA